MKTPCNIFKLLFTATCILTILSCTDEKCTNLLNEGTYIFGYAFLDSADTHSDILVRIIQTNDTTYTDASGYYEFLYQQPNTYTIVATLEGYEPSFTIVYVTGGHPCQAQNLELSISPCTPKDSLPDGYPLGVRFCADISFAASASSYYIGDSLFITAWEFYLPPLLSFREGSLADDGDVIVISSLGDKEIKHVDIILGSIPEVWSFGYIIDSAASTIPILNNGVIEVEPTGGWVTAMYQSYWLKRYVCKSIEMLPEP